jgi:hypothetical protein
MHPLVDSLVIILFVSIMLGLIWPIISSKQLFFIVHLILQMSNIPNITNADQLTSMGLPGFSNDWNTSGTFLHDVVQRNIFDTISKKIAKIVDVILTIDGDEYKYVVNITDGTFPSSNLYLYLLPLNSSVTQPLNSSITKYNFNKNGDQQGNMITSQQIKPNPYVFLITDYSDKNIPTFLAAAECNFHANNDGYITVKNIF